MPSYSYNDGDGLAVIDKTVPNGAVEPVSNLDDALKQVKAYLVDPVAGVAKIQADLTAGQADITSLGTRMTAAETNITTGAAEIVALGNQQAATDAKVDSLVITAGGSPITLVAIANATQDFAQNAVVAVVNFNVASLDTGAGFNTGTHVYTVPVAGLYRATARLKLTTTASASPVNIAHRLVLRINTVDAAEVLIPAGTNVSDRTIEINGIFQVAGTNTIDVIYSFTTDSGTMTSRIVNSNIGTTLQLSRLST